ncbi:MAG: DVU0150 family protein [Acidobacteriota bacterium]
MKPLPVLPLWRHRLRAARAWLTTAAIVLLSVEALAAPAKPARKLVNVADTRGLDPGITRWIADLYNSSYWLFGLFTVALMALMGLALGFACDRAMGLLGIHLGRMEHHE